jgi:dTDP-4-amino-4,6-dideoxygalactose transaminase
VDYRVPLFDLNYDKSEEQAVLDVLKSKWISTGPKAAEFENQFASMLDSKYALSTANCTVSLHLALKVIGIKAGDEVICPSLTFVATANSIRYLDATPVFADVCSLDNPTIDPQDILRKITPKTKAIIVMHYAGFSCEMDAILNIARRHNLKVIEDACHGPMSDYKGKKLGTIGDIGCFSFFSNKNISTGEGGMLVTDNKEYAEKTKLLRSHGMTSMSYERSKGHSTSYDVVDLGYNYRMDDIRSALGVAQLKKLENDLIKRSLVRDWYIEHLLNISQIIIPFARYSDFSSNYIFPIVLVNSDYKNRDRIRDLLKSEGIQTSVHYPPVHNFSIYQKFKTKLPVTEYFSNCMVTLPMYSTLSISQIKFIAKIIKDSLG